MLEAKYHIDEIYQAGVVEPLRQLGETFFAVDRYIVDGLVALIGAIPQMGGWTLKFTTQRGYLQGYAAAMLHWAWLRHPGIHVPITDNRQLTTNLLSY